MTSALAARYHWTPQQIEAMPPDAVFSFCSTAAASDIDDMIASAHSPDRVENLARIRIEVTPPLLSPVELRPDLADKLRRIAHRVRQHG